VIGDILGLKPQAESFHPFGIILTGLLRNGSNEMIQTFIPPETGGIPVAEAAHQAGIEDRGSKLT